MKFSPEKARRWSEIVFVGLFVFALWLPTADTFLKLDKAPTPNEKRAPAKFPVFENSLQGLRNFFAGLDAYYSDHFGFRKRLIRWEHKWKRGIFRESSLSDVMIGREGWLYYAGGNMIEHARAATSFQTSQLEEWKDLLEGRQKWCADRGIKYQFVISPDKHSIYPEYLPEWMTRVGTQTKLDHFLEWMKSNSTVPVLDLRPSLIEAKKVQRTYLYTDTHWNLFGGFIASQAVVKELSKQVPGLVPHTIDQYRQSTIEQAGGDLAGMLGQEQSLREKDYVLLEALPPLRNIIHVTDTNILKKEWNKGSEPVFTKNPEAKGKVVIFRDSFAGGWVPFLAHHFNEVIYLWQYNWDKGFLEQQKPDVVIDEMVERFFLIQDPKTMKKKDEEKNATIASHQGR